MSLSKLLNGFRHLIDRLLQGGSRLFQSRQLVIIGDSMLPTLVHRQRVQTWPLPKREGRGMAKRGDIIAFRHPQKPQIIYVKRIVGLPNEHIFLGDDGTVINGELQPEPYLSPSAPRSGEPRRSYPRQWFADGGEYFVLGDNRTDSEDSRSFGPVAQELIIGRVRFRYWPPRWWGDEPINWLGPEQGKDCQSIPERANTQD